MIGLLKPQPKSGRLVLFCFSLFCSTPQLINKCKVSWTLKRARWWCTRTRTEKHCFWWFHRIVLKKWQARVQFIIKLFSRVSTVFRGNKTVNHRPQRIFFYQVLKEGNEQMKLYRNETWILSVYRSAPGMLRLKSVGDCDFCSNSSFDMLYILHPE